MTIIQTLHWVQFAGTEKVCVDLCNELAKKHTVYLLTSKNIKPYIDDNVHLIEIDFEKNRYNPLFLYSILQILQKTKPDIIHIHNTKELEVMYNSQIFRKENIPIVGTRHNPVLKKKFALADLGVAVSDETRQYTNAKKNITIYNGIPDKETHTFEEHDTFTIVAVGRLAPVKGFDTLIKAFSRVDFKYQLLILGEGEQKEELQTLIHTLGLEEKVQLVGFVNNVHDYIYNSDLQIISSSEEGLSLALIEAIFYAKVLIATDIANHKELLGEDLVFDNTIEAFIHKLTEVNKDYTKYQTLFAKIKKRKKEFSVEKVTENYIDAYTNLINKKGIK